MLLTPLGILPVDRFDGGLAAPDGTRRLANAAGALMARTASGWQVWTASGWVAADPPEHDRTLAEDSGRRWQRRAGLVEVVAVDPAEGWRIQGRGLAFDADRLVALAALPDRIVAVTGIGTETATTLANLGPLDAPDAPDPAAGTLDALPFRPGDMVLWAETGDGRRVWNGAAGGWVAPDPARSPWLARLALDAGDIAAGFERGAEWASVAVTGADGQSAPARFDWSRGGQMPFDRVTALHADAGRLMLGTAFGLRLMRDGGVPADEGLFAATAGQGTVAVPRLGRPANDPALLLAETAGGCLDILSSGAPQPCADASGLAERLAVQTPLWRWTETDDAARGAYLLADGSALPLPDRLGGGMPHDLRRAVIGCGSQSLELWQGSDIAAQWTGAAPLRLDLIAIATGLHCQTADAPLGGGETLEAAPYALIGGGAAVLDARGGWGPVSANLALAATTRQAGLVPWEAERLRLSLTDGLLRPEYRWRDDTWAPLAWDGGRMPVDRIDGVALDGAQIAAVTPVGVTLRTGAGIDSDSLLLAVADDRAALSACRVDRIEGLDGSTQAAPSASGAPLRFRCADGRVWQGAPGEPADEGALTAAADPFLRRVLIRDALWQWERIDSRPGQSGALTITFRGEGLALDGGRFDIDS